ncbi:MAG: type II toxin-antitoxin system RelE/ParE family toxin [Nitrospinae bacterium]|nr:type II toxin-antitoxin system RelE/ParE family toxin [Nitrospinota bacterium]MBF0633623.1 type II toxin-antitoxin system RelE/ParE family toxin [Nitrospinota bacterium]
MKITFAASAVRDMEGLLNWYAEQSAPEVGHRFVEEIFGQVERLASHPQSGRIVPEFDQPFLRELIHPPFRIVYKLEREKVRVVRIWRSERRLRIPTTEE